LGTLQVWQALSEAQGRGRGEEDVAILFLDLVGFSAWALQAGDEAAVTLLRDFGRITDGAVVERGGRVVKRLGDGAMARVRGRRGRGRGGPPRVPGGRNHGRGRLR